MKKLEQDEACRKQLETPRRARSPAQLPADV